MRIHSNGHVGIGTSSPTTMSISMYSEWLEILELSNTSPAVKIALDKLRTTVYLSKDHGSKT